MWQMSWPLIRMDPEGQQLRVLQRVLKRLTVRLTLVDGYSNLLDDGLHQAFIGWCSPNISTITLEISQINIYLPEEM